MDGAAFNRNELDYLQLLARQFPTIRAAATEIVTLSAAQQLPKGTEHFLSDIHGEYEAFSHVLRNGSGSVKRRIDEVFAGELDANTRQELATLIYYPEERLRLILEEADAPEQWYATIIGRLIKLCRVIAAKYTRAALRAALPADFADVIATLLQEQPAEPTRLAYHAELIHAIIATGEARDFIETLAELIQQLVIARLHIIGDIYDRGPGAHKIMDTLLAYHRVDVQWGNHDIVWMGAAAGSEACIANVIRIALRYANLETLQDGYGISLLPLATFAMNVYRDDPCAQFTPRASGNEEYTENELRLMAKMHKAISIIQFKLEGQLIDRRPEFDQQDRRLLHRIDHHEGVVALGNRHYPLIDNSFPTIDPAGPYQLTAGEENVIRRLRMAFRNSDRLQEHVRFLFNRGSMYLIHNGNLLYHGCIPMESDGSFTYNEVGGRRLGPREYMDHAERLARQGYFSADPRQRQAGQDMMWALWSSRTSPLYGKDRMATFERYFLDASDTHRETKNPYYDYRDQERTAARILVAFGLDADRGHIINGHVPVRVTRGESPVKASGRLLVIDGGFSKAYQDKTGIAGYTLVCSSRGLILCAHEPFASKQSAIEQGVDIHSQTEILETSSEPIMVRETDDGLEMRQRISALQRLLQAYRAGLIKERQ